MTGAATPILYNTYAKQLSALAVEKAFRMSTRKKKQDCSLFGQSKRTWEIAPLIVSLPPASTSLALSRILPI